MKKKSSEAWSIHVENILKAIDEIEQYLGPMTLIELRENKHVLDSIIKNFGIIVKAVEDIPVTVRYSSHNVPWKHMIMLTNYAINKGVADADSVWNTIQNILPSVKQELINTFFD